MEESKDSEHRKNITQLKIAFERIFFFQNVKRNISEYPFYICFHRLWPILNPIDDFDADDRIDVQICARM